MSVLAYGFGQTHLAVLICADLVMILLVVDCKTLNLRLTLLTQHRTYRHEQFHYHVLHKVMTLQEQIGVILPYAHRGKFLTQGFHLGDSLGIMVLHPANLMAHPLRYAQYRTLRTAHVD